MLARLVSQASASGALRQAEALGAQAHLGGGLLAREVDRAAAGVGEGGGDLQQQRRFADAGLAADQQGGARHDAAAGDAVELGQAGRDARDPCSAALGQRLERHRAALGRLAPGRSPAAAAASASSSMRVPLAAGHAFAGPARRRPRRSSGRRTGFLAALRHALRLPPPRRRGSTRWPRRESSS